MSAFLKTILGHAEERGGRDAEGASRRDERRETSWRWETVEGPNNPTIQRPNDPTIQRSNDPTIPRSHPPP